LPEVSRLCLYLCSISTPAGAGGYPGKMPDKLIYVFIIAAPLTEAAKKRLVKGVFNRGNFPGAEVRLFRLCF